MNKPLPIGEAAKRLGISPWTLRKWEQNDTLPAHLYPERDASGNRVYSEDLVEHIREWLIARGRRSPAENLKGYVRSKV